MEIHIRFSRNDQGIIGTSYVPRWGEGTWALTNATIDDRGISFNFEKNCCSIGVFRGMIADGKISGTYKFENIVYRFSLHREEARTPKHPLHPQAPRPPFPYRREKRFIPERCHTFDGLTLPPARGPPVSCCDTPPRQRAGATPSTGSGYLLSTRIGVIGYLQTGFAAKALRSCLPTAGAWVIPVGITGTRPYRILIDDTLSAFKYLQTRDDIVQSNVGLMGSSLGGAIAAATASRSRDVCFVVMLSTGLAT